MLLGVTDAERFSLEMTALGEAALAAGWLMALAETAEAHGVPRDRRGRMIPAAIVGIGKFGGRRADDGLRSRPLRRLRRWRRGITGGPRPDGRGRAGRGARLLRSRRRGARLDPRRHHGGRRGLPRRPAAAPRLEGQRVCLEPRRRRALLPGVGGSLGAPDADARAARRRRSARRPGGAARDPRPALWPRGGPAGPEGDARAAPPHGARARQGERRGACTSSSAAAASSTSSSSPRRS